MVVDHGLGYSSEDPMANSLWWQSHEYVSLFSFIFGHTRVFLVIYSNYHSAWKARTITNLDQTIWIDNLSFFCWPGFSHGRPTTSNYAHIFFLIAKY